jgi:TolA-binding protein
VAEQWKSQIQAQKNAISSLQSHMNILNESIRYAGGNCISGCVQWNERQKQKQDQVESMKVQLEELQKRLEEMQDAARKQGFGSSVYDP